MNAVFYYVAWLLQIFLLVLFARVIMGYVLAFTRYRPSGAAAVAFEFVYTITDPPLKFLKRFIPDLRLGNFSLDLSFIVLFIVLRIVIGMLFAEAAGR